MKALINPHEKDNWKSSVNPGGLIEMTIAEQQKTLNMFTAIVKDNEPERETNGILPIQCLEPIKKSGLGTGNLAQNLTNLAMINAAKRPPTRTPTIQTRTSVKLGNGSVSEKITEVADKSHSQLM